MIESHAAEHARNRNAHGRMHRQQIGQDDSDQADDEMGNTILGDVTNPAPIVIQGSSGSSNNSLLTLTLGAVLGGGGIFLGQMLSKPVIPSDQAMHQQSQPAVNQDTTTTIGLGRIEDYLGQSGAGK